MLTVLVDDVRRFTDGRDCLTYRTSAEAVSGLRALAVAGTNVDELWLDHDLGRDDTVAPVLRLLEELAEEGHPLRIGTAYVITVNPAGAVAIKQVLQRLGYPFVRLYSLRGVLTWAPVN